LGLVLNVNLKEIEADVQMVFHVTRQTHKDGVKKKKVSVRVTD
jgi:hypothetical protein